MQARMRPTRPDGRGRLQIIGDDRFERGDSGLTSQAEHLCIICCRQIEVERAIVGGRSGHSAHKDGAVFVGQLEDGRHVSKFLSARKP